MKIFAALLLVATGLSGCVIGEDYGFSHVASTDCASEGRQRPISYDNGAGVTWQKTNTSRWCSPRGGLNPQGDPVFEGSN